MDADKFRFVEKTVYSFLQFVLAEHSSFMADALSDSYYALAKKFLDSKSAAELAAAPQHTTNTNMDLETMINNVLPEGSVLYKHNHGLFSFYLDDVSFMDGGAPFSEMKVGERFSEFILRTITKLIEKEEGTENPSTTIDWAINFRR